MEGMEILNAFLALIFVLALIGLVSIALRKIEQSKIPIGSKGKNKRLSIADSLILDGKRRLLLIKCDDKEHLLLISGDKETIIEHDINTIKIDSNKEGINETNS